MKKSIKINVIMMAAVAVLILGTGFLFAVDNGNGESFSGVNEVYAINHGTSIPSGYKLLPVGEENALTKSYVDMFVYHGVHVPNSSISNTNPVKNGVVVDSSFIVGEKKGSFALSTITNDDTDIVRIYKVLYAGNIIYQRDFASESVSTSWAKGNTYLTGYGTSYFLEGAYFDDLDGTASNNWLYYNPNSGYDSDECVDVTICFDEHIKSVSASSFISTPIVFNSSGMCQPLVFGSLSSSTDYTFSCELTSGYRIESVSISGEGFSFVSDTLEDASFALQVATAYGSNLSIEITSAVISGYIDCTVNFDSNISSVSGPSTLEQSFTWSKSGASNMLNVGSLADAITCDFTVACKTYYQLSSVSVDGNGFSVVSVSPTGFTLSISPDFDSELTINVTSELKPTVINVTVNFPSVFSSKSFKFGDNTQSWSTSGYSYLIDIGEIPDEGLNCSASLTLADFYTFKNVIITGDGVELLSLDKTANTFAFVIEPEHSVDITIDLYAEITTSGYGYYIPEGYVLLPSDPEQCLKHDNVPFYFCMGNFPFEAPDGYFSAELISAEFFNGCDTGLIFESFDLGYWAYGYYLGGIELYYDIWVDSRGANSIPLNFLNPMSDTLSIADITLNKGAYFNFYPEYDADFVTNTFFYVPEWALTEAAPTVKEVTITFDDGVESVALGDTVWTESGQAQSVTFDDADGYYTFDVVYKDGSHLNKYLFDAFGDVECDLNGDNDLVFLFVENLGTEYLISIDITTLPLKKDLYVAFDSGASSVSCGDYVWSTSEEAVLIKYPENAADFTFNVELAEGYRIVAVSYVFYGDTENILNAEWSGSSFTINVAESQALLLISIMTENSVYTAPLTITFDEGVEKVTCGDLTWTESGQSNDITYDFTSGEAQTLTFTVAFKDGYMFSDYAFEQTGGVTSSRNGNVLTFTYSIDNAALSSLALMSFKFRQELTINWDIGIEQISSNGVTWLSGETHSYDFNQDSTLYYFDVALDLDEYFIESVGMGYSTDAVTYDGFSDGKLKFTIPEGEFLAQINIAVELVPKEDGTLRLIYPKFVGNTEYGFNSSTYGLSEYQLVLSGGYVFSDLDMLKGLVAEYFTSEELPAGSVISLVDISDYPAVKELSFPLVVDGHSLGAMFGSIISSVVLRGSASMSVQFLGYQWAVDVDTLLLPNDADNYLSTVKIPQFASQSATGKLLFSGYNVCLYLNLGKSKVYLQFDGKKEEVDFEIHMGTNVGFASIDVSSIPLRYYLNTVYSADGNITFVFSKDADAESWNPGDKIVDEKDGSGGISGIGDILTTLGWVAGIGLIGYVVLSVLPDRRRR